MGAKGCQIKLRENGAGPEKVSKSASKVKTIAVTSRAQQ